MVKCATPVPTIEEECNLADVQKEKDEVFICDTTITDRVDTEYRDAKDTKSVEPEAPGLPFGKPTPIHDMKKSILTKMDEHDTESDCDLKFEIPVHKDPIKETKYPEVIDEPEQIKEPKYPEIVDDPYSDAHVIECDENEEEYAESGDDYDNKDSEDTEDDDKKKRKKGGKGKKKGKED